MNDRKLWVLRAATAGLAIAMFPWMARGQQQAAPVNTQSAGTQQGATDQAQRKLA